METHRNPLRRFGGGSMSHIFMGGCPAATFLERQPLRCPIQGLNLTLLIHAQNDRFVGQIKIDPHDVGELFDKATINGAPTRLSVRP